MESAMNIRFVTKTIHAFLDYPVALSLMVTPFILGLGQVNPLARWLSVATGVAVFVLTFLTDHKTGVVRVLPYWLHLWVDRLVGIVFIAAPFAWEFHGLDAWYYWANGATVLLVTVVLNTPEDETHTLVNANA
jgi:hypothetical protein